MSCSEEKTDVERQAAELAMAKTFDRFWPARYPFPPGAPWLATSVSRSRARPIVIRFGVNFPGAAEGNYSGLAAMIAWMVTSQSSSGRRVRRDLGVEAAKKPKKPPTFDTPEIPQVLVTTDCWQEDCSDAGEPDGTRQCCQICDTTGEDEYNCVIECGSCQPKTFGYSGRDM